MHSYSSTNRISYSINPIEIQDSQIYARGFQVSHPISIYNNRRFYDLSCCQIQNNASITWNNDDVIVWVVFDVDFLIFFLLLLCFVNAEQKELQKRIPFEIDDDENDDDDDRRQIGIHYDSSIMEFF